jgi:peptide/nickel transport system permease protein
MGVTLYLGIFGFVIAMLLGVSLGILAAVRKRTVVDRSVVGLGVIGVSAPAFATGILLLYVFAVVLGWFPSFGQGEGFADKLWHFALPAFALALTAMALVLKLTRAAMITALDQDYVAFARARGLPARRVLGAYALRNALVPVVTAAGLILGYMLTGAVLVEVTFALPGVGSLLVESVTFKDVPMVQGVAMVVAFVIILVNLLTDVLYLFIDPRIRFGSVAA